MGAILEVDCWVPGMVIIIANPFHLVLELLSMDPRGENLFHLPFTVVVHNNQFWGFDNLTGQGVSSSTV